VSEQVFEAVERTVAAFARAHRHDLWPRFTAKAAGVSTEEAREAMLDLVESGLLDLWYVVIADSGDEVKRFKHPDKAPVGAQLVNYRSEEPDPFVVEADDIYLMFSPTLRLERMASAGGDSNPKAEGTGASALSVPAPRPTTTASYGNRRTQRSKNQPSPSQNS
jgi:hypothetical protein